MSASVAPYIALITSQHVDKPKFVAKITVTVQPFADARELVLGFIQNFDFDQAVGQQLDYVGIWIGFPRPFGMTDASYRLLLSAKILVNQWDGTKDGAYKVWDAIFGDNPDAPKILIQDNNDMTIVYALLGTPPDAEFLELFLSGQLAVKSAGVRITGFYTEGAADTPYFGFDVENSSISGYDVGAWPYENGV